MSDETLIEKVTSAFYRQQGYRGSQHRHMARVAITEVFAWLDETCEALGSDKDGAFDGVEVRHFLDLCREAMGGRDGAGR